MTGLREGKELRSECELSEGCHSTIDADADRCVEVTTRVAVYPQFSRSNMKLYSSYGGEQAEKRLDTLTLNSGDGDVNRLFRGVITLTQGSVLLSLSLSLCMCLPR